MKVLDLKSRLSDRATMAAAQPKKQRRPNRVGLLGNSHEQSMIQQARAEDNGRLDPTEPTLDIPEGGETVEDEIDVEDQDWNQ